MIQILVSISLSTLILVGFLMKKKTKGGKKSLYAFPNFHQDSWNLVQKLIVTYKSDTYLQGPFNNQK